MKPCDFIEEDCAPTAESAWRRTGNLETCWLGCSGEVCIDLVGRILGDTASRSLLSRLGANGLGGAIWELVSYRRFCTLVGAGGGPMSSPRLIFMSASLAACSIAVLPCSSRRK